MKELHPGLLQPKTSSTCQSADVEHRSDNACRRFDFLIVGSKLLKFCHLLFSHAACALCLHSSCFGLWRVAGVSGWFGLECLCGRALWLVARLQQCEVQRRAQREKSWKTSSGHGKADKVCPIIKCLRSVTSWKLLAEVQKVLGVG